MDELVKAGHALGLHFELAWSEESQPKTAAEVTRGRLRMGTPTPVWVGPEGAGVSWTWVELLEWLSVTWPSLLYEEGLPFGMQPARPSALAAMAEARWDGMPEERRSDEELVFETFEEHHNLARGVQGIMLSPVWLVRYGRVGFVCSDRGVAQHRYSDAIRALEDLGDAIARRLRSQPLDARAQAALSSWADRTSASIDLKIEIASGLSTEALEQISGTRSLVETFRQTNDSFETNELLAVARQASQFTPDSISAVLRLVEETDQNATPELDYLSTLAIEALREQQSMKSFEEGYFVAEWLRDTLGVEAARQVNPTQVLAKWGVELREIDLPTSGIDALGCWGPSVGPAVFMNKRGRHNATAGGYRATLAHEICHLLLDRDGTLPLAEVLGGAEAPGTEARARAFAAEFLLPRKEAGALMGRADDPGKAIRSLQQRYGVSMEVVAWQARNSGATLPEDVLEILRSKVSQPDRF